MMWEVGHDRQHHGQCFGGMTGFRQCAGDGARSGQTSQTTDREYWRPLGSQKVTSQ